MSPDDDDGGHRDDPGACAMPATEDRGEQEAGHRQHQEQQHQQLLRGSGGATLAVASWASLKNVGHRYSRMDAYSSTSGVRRLR